MKNALLVYPEFLPSYWSEKYALEFINRKAAMPPLSLLTLAAFFPSHYNIKIIDMNIEPLSDKMIDWADYVFCSAMIVQKDSFHEVIRRCNQRQCPVIAGGPYPSSFQHEMHGVDHLVAGEVEDNFAAFLSDLESGKAKEKYEPARDTDGKIIRPGIEHTVVPRYDLVDLKKYGSVALQFSRGCPYNCEFCDITKLFGRVPRTKSNAQVLSELDMLHECGWRGSVFFVDDNFIGNRENARRLLPAIHEWQRQRNFPFSFYTEATANLAEMPELLQAMVDAGFQMVFLGLETPNVQALKQVKKSHNIKFDDPDYLFNAVRKIQASGMEVSAGFILGLDGDDEHASEAQFNFIQRAGIPTAMVGLLNVLRGTDLYERLSREGRIICDSSGNNLSINLNYIPKIDRETLLLGYKNILASLYDKNLKNYFARCYTLLKNWNIRAFSSRPIHCLEVLAIFKSLRRQLFSKQGPAYFEFLTKVVLRRPRMFAEAVRLAIMGYHYEKVVRQQLLLSEFISFLESEQSNISELLNDYADRGAQNFKRTQKALKKHLSQVKKRYKAIHKDFRFAVNEAMLIFRVSLEKKLDGFSHEIKLERWLPQTKTQF